MEINFGILEPTEKTTENTRKIDWPDNPEFFRMRDEYLKDHMEAASEQVKGLSRVGQREKPVVARLICEAMFMTDLMRKISPIKLEHPVNIKFIHDVKEDDISFGSKMSVTPKYNESGETLLSFDLTLNLDAVIDEAESNLRNQKLFESDAQYLSSPVHEFGHMLYIQEASKNPGRKQTEYKDLTGDTDRYENLSEVEFDYLLKASDLEIKGRLWQIAFLRKYFKHSNLTFRVDRNLKERQVHRREMQDKGFLD